MEVLGRHIHVNVDVQELIVANLLCHWDETLDVISNEPNGKYIGVKINTHPFVHAVHTAMNINAISIGTLTLTLITKLIS